MNAAVSQATRESPALRAAIERACRVVAPSWPLDRQIAVNPCWSLVDQPFPQVAATLHRLTGGRFALAPQAYLEAWRSGLISPEALERALAESGVPTLLDCAVAALKSGRPPSGGLPLPSDIVDRTESPTAGPSWHDVITQQVSQYCASYFDEHQSDWRRGRACGLYLGWRAVLRVDHALEPLKHAPEIRARSRDLPDAPDAAIAWALDRIGVPLEDATEFLQACLLRINGWASWCAYLGWQAGLAGSADAHLRDLLAIRTCWEALLWDGSHRGAAAGIQWRDQWARARCATAGSLDASDLIWQRAQEISYQDRLIKLLGQAPVRPVGTQAEARPPAQLVFCIDVRSERFRRALEATDPTIDTRGFAGFFGLPIRYQPIGVTTCRPQLPGLLLPSLDVSDSTGRIDQDHAVIARRARTLDARVVLQPFQRSPSGAFSLVETIGMGYAGALLRRHFGGDSAPIESFGLAEHDARALRPQLILTAGDAIRRKAELVAATLRAMSLTSGFARLLVFVGHGSQSANNPQSAALDCGACGGQTGEVNARVLAGLLNDAAVRDALRAQGIHLPADTVAIGAFHNTTTDEVTLLDIAGLPGSHAEALQSLERSLGEAGHRTRAERAPDLGLGGLASNPAALLKRLRQRARDWAETRPEWGLANNAAFIVAPRCRTRGLDLGGRSFLHDYSSASDPDGKVLELIMTAPLVVTHWINLQYYASTVDPDRFGSGNKVLHNVACGRIGVFEGNTGDLRIGLSRQSLHDGERWMHTPLRLSVIIDAPRDRIDTVLGRHATVRHLVSNQWLYLFRFAEEGFEWHREGRWQPWTPERAAA